MSRDPVRLGICAKKTQGKILVQLKEGQLPKIGTRTVIKRNGIFKEIGKILEVIGSTRNPWIVISVNQGMYQLVRSEDVIFSQESRVRKKTKWSKRRKKGKKTQKSNV